MEISNKESPDNSDPIIIAAKNIDPENPVQNEPETIPKQKAKVPKPTNKNKSATRKRFNCCVITFKLLTIIMGMSIIAIYVHNKMHCPFLILFVGVSVLFAMGSCCCSIKKAESVAHGVMSILLLIVGVTYHLELARVHEKLTQQLSKTGFGFTVELDHSKAISVGTLTICEALFFALTSIVVWNT